jgi:hypothetical protein
VTANAWSIQCGRYVCVRTRSRFLGPIIRWATRSDYDHAFMVGPDGKIIQAAFTGVQYARLADYAGCPAVVNGLDPMTTRQRELAWEHARTLVGASYDYLDLDAIALDEFGWRWQWLIRLCAGRRAFICSQVVALCGMFAALRSWLCGQEAANMVTPAMLSRRPGMVPVSWEP